MYLLVILLLILASVAAFWAGASKVVLFAAAGIPAALWLLRRPRWAVVMAMVSHAWGVAIPGTVLTPFKGFVVIMALSVLGRITQRRHLEPLPWGYLLSITAVLALALISEAQAPWGANLGWLSELIAALLVLLCMSQVSRDEDDARMLAFAQTLNLILIGVTVAYEVGWTRMAEGVVRARGLAGHPNGLGEYVARNLAMSAAIIVDRRNSRTLRWAGGVGILMGVYSLFGSASRGGTVGTVLALGVFFLMVARGTAGKIFGLIVAGVVVSTALQVAPKSFRVRVVGSVTGENKQRDITSDRAEQWVLAARLLPQRPLQGWGTNGFAEENALTGNKRTALHSAYLSALFAWGIPAGLLYGGLMLLAPLVGMRAIMRWRVHRVYGAAVVAGVVGAATSLATSPEVFRASAWNYVGMVYLFADIQRRKRNQAVRDAQAGRFADQDDEDGAEVDREASAPRPPLLEPVPELEVARPVPLR